ncbi:Mob1/phocein [Schizophyllum amplum]|uniref:Mob1/phocein n=1 Tax=Schizophyllum amplum TaxID=97359 RepID=A0A550CJ29_9AGAR|nr:Mob1/phocein [Auriculariopsis ampla]
MSVVVQRPLRGARISSFYPVKSLPALASLDSAFQLQEYISLLIRLDVHDVEHIVSLPDKNASKSGDADMERRTDASVDQYCWIYEQLRRLAQDLTHPLCTMLQLECNRQTCPEMKAGEWLYLCVAHGNDGAMEQCCAIDYILHTIDSATALLNSPRAFPSRLQIPTSSHRHFSALARRLGRIFAHAYFHHREAFEQAEAESSLYARFLALTQKFDLVPTEFLVIPPRIDPEADVQPPRVLPSQSNFDHQQNPLTLDTHAAEERARSPPGLGGQESPRKFGRNRTDTMVFSEAASVVEELSKSDDIETAEPGQTVRLEEATPMETEPEAAEDVQSIESAPEETAAETDTTVPVDTAATSMEDPFADEQAAADESAEPTSTAEEAIPVPPPAASEDAPTPAPEDESSPAVENVPTPAPADAPTPAPEADPIMPADPSSPPAGADEEMPAHEPSAAVDEKPLESVATPAEEEEAKETAPTQDEPSASEEADEEATKKPEEAAKEPEEVEQRPEEAAEETTAEPASAESHAPSYAAAVAENIPAADMEEAEKETTEETKEITEETKETTDVTTETKEGEHAAAEPTKVSDHETSQEDEHATKESEHVATDIAKEAET